MTHHHLLRRGVALASAAGIAASTIAVTASAAHADPSGITNNCDLGQTVGELQSEGYGDDNIIVFREDRMASMSFDRIVRSGRIVAEGCQENTNRTYLWFVFEGQGEFVRSGDGGYRNWAFYGVFDQPSDNVVQFHPRA